MANRKQTGLFVGAILCFLAAATAIVGCNYVVGRNADDRISTETTAAESPDNESPGDLTVKSGPKPAVSDGSRALFDELTAEQTGVAFEHRLDAEHPLAHLYHSGFQCGGVSLGDVNGDGLADIFLVSGPDENALFINKGDLRFEKSPASALLAGGDAWGVGASMSDVDGDGDLDIFVCNYDAPNHLWLNLGADANGQLSFRECSSVAGVSYQGPSHTPYFTDIDLDGDLDLFLLTNRLHAANGRPSEPAYEYDDEGQQRIKQEYAPYLRIVEPEQEMPGDGSRPVPGKFILEYGHDDRIYRNEGLDSEGVPRFRDVTADCGLKDIPGHGLSALVWDINQDNRPDIYVANDYSDPDRLWLNQGKDENGVVQFKDATAQFLPYTSWFSMGSDVADIDNDGRLDFMVADMAARTHFKAKTTMGEMSGWRRWVLENAWPRQAMRNVLFTNTGIGRFREIGFIAGVARSDWTWAVRFADFDLDGRNDLFLTNGVARMFSDSDIYVKPEMMVGKTEWDIFRDTPEMREKNLAYRNVDGQYFQDQSDAWNLGKDGMSYGAATADLDGDGDLELVVCNLTENVSIYRNNATDTGLNWLRVRLEDELNRYALGALVTASFSDGSTKVRLLNPQSGFLSSSEPILHFGLGEQTDIESLSVRWPDGAVQTLGRQQANQLIVVKRSDAAGLTQTPAGSDQKPADPPRFVQAAKDIGLDFTHTERPFDDYRREFLLPGKLSQFGPGIAVADVNGDKLDDVFVGGAAGQSAVLFVNTPDGRFKRAAKAPWEAEAVTEDMGALFLDADRDGDLDLYVVRGSNEWRPGDPRYQDALFLNVSQPGEEVVFAKAPAESLPAMRESGSCVVGCDFDRDGDVDLFVGARSQPGKYPLTPNSTLLRNDGTQAAEVRFTNVTSELAPQLEGAGLVTGALWSDVNQDGWTDLLVTCEWGPVRLFMNQKGRLVDSTASTELEQRSGWWNAITGADFDGDGDIDYAVCNVGHNTKYGVASKQKPAILYRGDMDLNGVFDLVEAKSSKDGELPVRGRSCSCNAMPLLRTKFPTYKGFASEMLPGIYSEQMLRTSERVVATEFASGLWINESTKTKVQFRWKPLPFDAQVSPCYGIVAGDLFGDQSSSIAMVQNLDSREPETGIWRAGLGCVLSPQRDGSVSSMSLESSGFVVSGDGKGLALADLNADGRPDLVATQNNGQLLAFLQTEADHRQVAVQLNGPPGNPSGIGGRVQLFVNEELQQTTEVYGGSGYLSQSCSTVFLSNPTSTEAKVVVTWPNGDQESADLKPGQKSLSFEAR